jgi:arylsulfatase A-like enzyme
MFLHTYDVHDRCPFRSANQAPSEPWSLQPDQDHQPLLAFYDDLIASTDGLVGGLVTELAKLGLAETTLIVVTGDHGEFFAERGYRGHGCDLKPYEPLVRVPLIMRYPSAIPARGEIGEPVSLIDVAPTILALLGVPIPADVRGTVLPGVGLDARHRQQPVYVVCDDKVMVRDGPTKLITSRSAAFPDELYDLGTDPGEVKSVTADTARLAPVKTLANAFQQSLPAPQKTSAAPDRQLDEGTKERLRALGYQ